LPILPRNGPLAGSATFPMQHTVTVGTDAATLAAFDAAALPADFDARFEAGDPSGLLTELQAAGRMWVGGTGCDGTHVVRVVVDEEPQGLASRAPAHSGRLAVPSGALWVCGAEYVASDPLRGSAATPKGGLRQWDMGARIDVPAGDYDLAVHELAPDDDDAPKPPLRAAQVLQVIPVLFVLLGAIAGVAATLALVVTVPWKLVQWATDDPRAGVGWHVLPWMLTASLGGAAVVWSGLVLGRHIDRLPSVVRANAAHAATRAARPDFVLVLRRRGDAAGPR
jgi:hypothetical protein